MNRNLDEVYFRIRRNEKWESVCFSDLTKDEMRTALENREREWLKTLCIVLGIKLKQIGDEFDLYGNDEESS